MRRTTLLLAILAFVLNACGASRTAPAPADTDTVGLEDPAPEGDIVGSGFW